MVVVQALHDSRNYVELPNPAELQHLVLAKQLKSIENVMQRLQASL